MKKYLIGILCFVVLLGLSACGGGQSSQEDTTDSGDSGEKQAEVNYEVGEGTAVTWTDSIGSHWVQIVVPVTNTGDENLYLESGTFDLEDESGSLLQTVDLVSVFPEVLKPGETACYCEETEADFDSDQKVKVIPHVEVKKATVDCIRLDVSETSISSGDFEEGVLVKGRVENTTDKDQESVYVAAVLYDSEDKVVGSVFTILDNTLAPGEKIGFEATSLAAPYSLTTDTVVHFEVYAYPSQMQF